MFSSPAQLTHKIVTCIGEDLGLRQANAVISFYILGVYKELLGSSVSSEGKMQITEGSNVYGEQEQMPRRLRIFVLMLTT